MHRLSDLVAVHGRSNPLLPGVGHGKPGAKRQAVRRRRLLPPVLAAQPQTVRRLGTKHGGVFADGIHFRYQGGQVRSLLSLLSYLGSGEDRKRYLGVKIPPTNIQDYHLQAARKFADGLADRVAQTGKPQ
jgi:hypothetical protein